MKSISVWATILAVVCGGATVAHSQTKDAESSQKAAAGIDRATGLALQGDTASALKAVSKLPASSFTGKDATFLSCMKNRFGATKQPISDLAVTDSWVATLATNYIAYWRHALSQPKERESAERDLRSAISKLLGRPVINDDEFDTAENAITNEAEKRGFHVLLGRTPPLRELMLWKKQTIEQRQVELPETRQSVTVHFLDDFVLRGWGSYATCERRSAGGWATDKGLFAVAPAYDSLQDETFSVRFLAHESQHFATSRRSRTWRVGNWSIEQSWWSLHWRM